ncbi:hypothetical protein AB0I81_36845 [Nonomuraea sp. NPDC050404]|uniref:STAS domain-containing protein n=1 Tax=Nonomuraea sp. NPDC050404 TaxID=3155783 RepID=UPI0033DDF6FC
MRLSIRLLPVEETTLVIALSGELDRGTRPDLMVVLDSIPPSPLTHVIVAAGDLEFCDPGGLDGLAVTHRLLQGRGGFLAIAEPQPLLCRLIELMAERDAWPPIALYPSLGTALWATGVEAHPSDAPPMSRHLPRMRRLPGAPSRSQRRSAAPPHPEPVERTPVERTPVERTPVERTPVEQMPVGQVPIMQVPVAPIIVRSRALHEQAVDRRRVGADRLGVTREARQSLVEARLRCRDSLIALRATRRSLLAASTAG